jgi:hypothetical protein
MCQPKSTANTNKIAPKTIIEVRKLEDPLFFDVDRFDLVLVGHLNGFGFMVLCFGGLYGFNLTGFDGFATETFIFGGFGGFGGLAVFGLEIKVFVVRLVKPSPSF